MTRAVFGLFCCVIVLGACRCGDVDDDGAPPYPFFGEGEGEEGEGEEGEGEEGEGEGEGEGEAPCTPPPLPVFVPTQGELYYRQLGLSGFALGEAAIVVGPDGSVVLVDVGNGSHDDDVLDALDDITALTGLPARTVDLIVITHFHADHADALPQLLDALTVRDGVVFRGFVDVDTASAGAYRSVCAALRDHPGLAQPLCTGDILAPCDPDAFTSSYPRSGCPGLGVRPLGEAQLHVIAASGQIGEAAFDVDVGPFNVDDSNGENGRSVVSVLSHGAFSLLVQGDLTGGGSDTDAVEPFYVDHLDDVIDMPAGVDVLHAGHHGRDTSSSRVWAERLLPADGHARNVVMGISSAHVGSPHASVLDELSPRLSGGRVYATEVAAGGASANVVDARGGDVVVVTVDGGRAYAIAAVDADGAVVDAQSFCSRSHVLPSD